MLKKSYVFLIFFLASAALKAQTADFSASPTVICVGQSVQFTDLSTGATSYTWTFPDGAAGQTSTLSNPIITYTIPGTYPVTLFVSDGVGSDVETKPNFITVLSTATATLTSAVGTDNQSVCVGSLITQIAYSVEGATGADFTGLPSFASGGFNPTPTGGTVTISGLTATAGVFPYSFSTTGPGCTPITVSGTINVTPLNSLTLTSAPGTANPTLCVNTPMTDIEFSVGGTPTSVVASGLPAGVSGSLVGSVFTISGTPTATGSFNYTVTATGGACSSVQYSGGISVDPDVQLLSAPGSINQTLCVNSPLGNIVYSLGPSITGATAIDLPPGVTGVFNPGQFVISNTPSAPGFYNYTVTTSGGSCGPAVVTGTITVNEAPTLVLNVAGTETQTLCINNPITDIAYTFGGSAVGAGVTGLPTGLTDIVIGDVLTISGTPTQSGVFNFTVFTTGSPCGTLNLNGTLTVHAIPQLNLSSAVGTDNQQACLNSPITPIVYTLTGTATNVSSLGLPAGVTSNFVGGNLTISGSPTAVGNFSYTVYTSGGTCPPDSSFGTLTVGLPPIATLSSSVGTDNQTICLGDGIDPIDYTISGGAITASAFGLPTGLTATFVAGTLTISGIPTAVGTTNYGVVASGGNCPNDTIFGAINVINPQINLVASGGAAVQQVCLNTPINPIAFVFSGGATGATAFNLPLGLTTSIQNDTVYVSGSPTTSGSFPFSIYTTGGPCDADTSYGVIVVVNPFAASLVSAPGTNAQVVVIGSPITTISYALSNTSANATAIDLPTGVTASTSAGTYNIMGTPAAVGSYTYGVVVSGGICPSDTIFGTISVIEPPLAVDTTDIFVPNLFSPNADGMNDKWEIPQLNQYTNTEVTVINREGQVVFEDPNYLNTWDGTFNGDPLPEATYYYVIRINQGEKILKGPITILRNEK